MGWTEPRTIRTRDGVAILIRTGEEDDAAALLGHMERSLESTDYAITEPGEVDQDEPKEREWVRNLRQPDNSLLLVAVHEADVVGVLSFHGGKRRKMVHSGHFGIGVDPEWRGRGIGRALLEALLDWAAAHPVIEQVTLGVVSENDGAIRLYKRLGFVEEGRFPGKFRIGPGRYWTDIQMSRWVKGGPSGASLAAAPAKEHV